MRECKCQSAWGPGVREPEEALPCRKAAAEVPSGAVSWEGSSPLNYGTSVEGVSHIRFCLWTWLFLHKEVIPSPSAYRLMSKDDKDLEMCLITDYSPEKITFISAEKPTSAIVEVATAENSVESSYLSTYWARRDEMQCGAHHEGFGDREGKDPESGASTVCVTGLSPHFRTDEHLNTLSLSQLGLKIILMKGIIFNVLMTMLLWGKKD